MHYLKADTNVEVLVGPVVAVGDGFTPVTTLNLSTADEAELIKYNGATALAVTDISANTMAAITGADGYYTLDLSTGNTDTEGFLSVVINDDSLCLPVRLDFMVVNANVYDSLFAAATTDYLQVDTTQVGGTSQTAGDIPALVTTVDTVVDGIQTDLDNATDGLGALKALIDTVDTVVDAIKVKTDSLTFTVANQVDANTLSVGGTTQTAGDLQALITTVDTVADGIQTDLSNGTDGLGALKTLIDTVDTVVDAIKAKTDSLTFTVASQVDANTIAISGDTAAADNLEASTETIVTGSVSAGTHTTALIDASDVTGQGDDTFIGRVLIFRTGTLQFEAGVITDFASATGQITFAASTWTVAPTSGDTFVIV